MIAPNEKLIDELKSTFGFDFYAEAVKQNEPTPKESAAAGIRNAMSFAELSIKSGAIGGHNLELIDQANAIMQAVLDNLDKQELPSEFGYHMSNAVNELQACTKLCSGKLQASVFDLSAAVEKLRGEL